VVWRDTTMTMPRVRLNYSRTNFVQINDERKKKIESDLISLENFYEIASEGFEYYWKKKYKNAYVKFQEVIDIIPLYHIFLIAAECAAKLKKVDEAIALNHKAMELNPKEYDPIYSNALIYKKLEKNEEVYSCLKQAVKLFKYDPIVSEFYKNSENTNYSSTQNNIFKLAMNVRSKDDCFQLLKELLQTGIVPHNFLEKKMMKFLNIKYFVFVFTLPEVKGIHVKRELKVTDAIADCPYYFANSKERGYKQVEFKDETPVSKKDAKIGFNLARKMLNKEILPARDNPLFGAIFRSDDDYDSILGFVPGYDMEKAQKTIEKQNFHVLRWDEFWNGVVDDVIIKKIMNE